MPREDNKYISVENCEYHFSFMQILSVFWKKKIASTSIPDPNKSYTNRYQHHKPSGYCYYI